MSVSEDLLFQVNGKCDVLNDFARLAAVNGDDLAAIRDPDDRPDMSDNPDLAELANLVDTIVNDYGMGTDDLDDPVGFYMTDSVLSVEYTMAYDGTYLGAQLTLAYGGPNVYLDTRTGVVDGYWGGEHCSRSVDPATCQVFDDRCAEYFEGITPRVDWPGSAQVSTPAVIMSQANAQPTMQAATSVAAAPAPAVAQNVAPSVARGM